jgi:hypothetical protein
VHDIRHHFRNHQPAEIVGPEGFIKKKSSLDGAEAEPNEGALAAGARGWGLGTGPILDGQFRAAFFLLPAVEELKVEEFLTPRPLTLDFSTGSDFRLLVSDFCSSLFRSCP